MPIKLCPQGLNNLAVKARALTIRLLWALSAVAMNTWIWHTGVQRHASIHQDQRWGLWCSAGSWFWPGGILRMYLGKAGAETQPCVRGNVWGKVLLGVSQGCAAGDSNSLRQQRDFLGHRTEH